MSSLDLEGGADPIPSWVGNTDEDREQYDRMRRRLFWTMPSGLYVVGSQFSGRYNAMTLNWVTQLSFEPKLLGICVENDSITHELITGSNAYSLNVLARADRALARKFAKPAQVDLDRKTLHDEPFITATTGAPVLAGALGYIDCAVVETVALGDHTLFAGQVVDAKFLQAEEIPVLRMEDTRMNYGVSALADTV